ncbi:hypothetical protein NQ318_003926 [Aromia moschata]|uniref:Chemosensory protein n=1 Tax=Aromia moschata TaxID=1265417 RepID=A0AAV8Z8B4_9CUCU|nr:hypothetical protein NQ318_003926 [Aromia moschata]
MEHNALGSIFILYFVITITVNCDDKYTGKYDNVNLEEIVKNDRLLKKYVDCLLDRGKCTNDAAELKNFGFDTNWMGKLYKYELEDAVFLVLQNLVSNMGVVLLLTVIFAVGVLSDQEYTNRYDTINLESIVQNDRLFKNYVNCLLDRGKCTKDAAELKRTIPDALETDCSKCTEKQRAGMRYMVKYLSTNKKDLWNELTEKYDPNGVYRAKYAEQISREGVQI